MDFWKYEGLGNDFIVVDERTRRAAEAPGIGPEAAIRLCDRHFGVGADGVLRLDRPRGAGVATMTVLNADGSTAEMCGNGLRCVARFLAETRGLDAAEVVVDTGAGPLTCRVTPAAVEVCLGAVTDHGPATLALPDGPLPGRRLALGNPHFVVRAPAGRDEALRHGPHVQPGGVVPEGLNLSCRRFTEPRHIELFVYERGCGLTLACGTGAGATVAAAWLDGDLPRGEAADVRLPGGTLTVFGDLEALWLRGPARRVYRGTLV